MVETYASDDINEEDVSELSSQNPHGLFVGGGGVYKVAQKHKNITLPMIKHWECELLLYNTNVITLIFTGK